MTSELRHRSVERWYRRLLRLYPRQYRERYQTELMQVFLARHQRISQKGLMGGLLFWLDAVRDVTWNALAVRLLSSSSRQPESPSGKADEKTAAGVLHDLRHALRILIKQPGFTAVVVLTLSLGIGATTALFSIIDGVLIAPLPYHESDQLVRIWEHDTKEGRVYGNLSPADYKDYQSQNSTLAAMGAFANRAATFRTPDELQRIPVQLVTVEVFDILGVPPMLGRTFRPDDLEFNDGNVVVLSNGFWRTQLGSDSSVIGSSVRLAGSEFEIIGVMPATFRPFSGDPQLWAPWSLVDDDRRPVHFVRSLARLRPGATVTEARTDLMTIARRLEADYPDINSGHLVTVEQLETAMVGEVRPALLMLLGAVGLVFLIACANLANLLLSRGVSRQQELAVRAALGAGRARLTRLLLTETLCLALLGGVVGFGLASVAVRVYVSVDPGTVPRLGNVQVDLSIFLFTLGLSVLSTLLFGLVPSLLASRLNIARVLYGGVRATASRKTQRLRQGLIVTQMALAMVLLLGAGLLARSFDRLMRVDLGFGTENLITGSVSLPGRRYQDPEDVVRFQQNLHAALRSAPGVIRSGTVTFLPLTGNSSTAWLNILGRPPWPDTPPEVNIINVSGDYFRTMGVRLLRGRLFDARDQRDAGRKTVINETMARLYWPEEDPIGQQIRLGPNPESEPWEIIGVVSDMRQFGLDSEPMGASFSASSQETWYSFRIVAQLDGQVDGPSILRDAVTRLDPELPVSDVMSMSDLVGDSVARPRLSLLLLTAFAVTALTIAAVGIYGVMAYSVAQRKHEIGVRLALGAQTNSVLASILRQGLFLAAVASAIGLAIGYPAAKTVEHLFFQVSPADPVILIGVLLLLFAVAAAASYLPALRAIRIDPVQALRAE